MKRIFAFVFAAVVAMLCTTSCLYKENSDCLVEWGFAKDTNSEITNGLETMLPSAQVIFSAFDRAFFSDYVDLSRSHEAMMKSQPGKSKAYNNAKKTADKAFSMIESGHTCPADFIFVVRVNYGGDGKYETVWSHDFRH